MNEICWNNDGDYFFLTTGLGTLQVLSYPDVQKSSLKLFQQTNLEYHWNQIMNQGLFILATICTGTSGIKFRSASKFWTPYLYIKNFQKIDELEAHTANCIAVQFR